MICSVEWISLFSLDKGADNFDNEEVADEKFNRQEVANVVPGFVRGSDSIRSGE